MAASLIIVVLYYFCNGTSVKRKLQYGEAREVSIAQNKTYVYVKKGKAT